MYSKCYTEVSQINLLKTPQGTSHQGSLKVTEKYPLENSHRMFSKGFLKVT